MKVQVSLALPNYYASEYSAMALAGPSLPFSEPCFPPYFGGGSWSTCEPQLKDLSLKDLPHLTQWPSEFDAPPALLPLGSINYPYFVDSPPHFGCSGEMLGGLTTPVMHPKLVDTIKSVISPSQSSSDHSGGWAGSGGIFSESSSDELRSYDELTNFGGGIRRSGGKRRHGLLMQQPEVYSLSSPDQLYSHHHLAAGEVEDDEALVVPVDLIQNRRPFNCAYAGCNKTFKNPQTMKMHHKTHYSEDSAYRLADANAHVPTTYRAGHNKKIPSRCPVCRKTFVGLYELRRHYGRKHTVGEKKYGCKKCGKKFYIEVDLRDHEKLCGEPIECKCGMKFAFKCNLVAHKKGHPECQDPPTEEEHKKIRPSTPSSHHQQPRSFRNNASSSSSSSARSNAASSPSASVCVSMKGSSPVTYCSMSSSPPLPRLTSAWSPTSHSSDEFSVPNFPSEDVMSTDDTLLSRDPSGILLASDFIL